MANFGWSLLIGSLTGISSSSVGVGEKVWDAAPKSLDGVHGKPWMFIVRDVLAQAASVPEAIAMIQSANRTCAIHLGIGDTATNTFRGLDIAKKAFQVYNWTMTWRNHPVIRDVFYWDKHVQPSHWPCLGGLLQQYNGNISAYNLAMEVAPKSKTGDFHMATFDYATLTAYFSNAQKSYITTGQQTAYARQVTRLDVKALFAVKQSAADITSE